MLILAATPIGNLEDASPRLRRLLSSVSVIAAEDTRNLKKLASHLAIKLTAEIISLHDHNEANRLSQLVELARSRDVLLVSDAGMPAISDPGFQLVRACVDAGIDVQVAPGPSAPVAALVVSGMPTDRFCFEGFIPRKSGDRIRAFEALKNERRTMIFFESPHRIQDSLEDAIKIFGPQRKASISRELTKKFEQTLRGTLEQLLSEAAELKGELVLVIAGAEPEEVELEDLVEKVWRLRETGMGMKQATAEIAESFGVSSSELYSAALKRPPTT